MSNKVKYGLKNVYYSVITLTNNVPIYATPVHIPGAVNLTLSPVGEKVKFAADDMEDYFAENVNNGYDGTLEMALIPDSFRIDVLGDILDDNNAIIENANATVKRFALMFEFDGDDKKARHVLYNVLANRPNIEGTTRSSTKEPKSETLEIEARPAVDTSNVKAKVEQSSDASYTGFFTTVYLEDAVTNTKAGEPTDFITTTPADVVVDATSNGTPAVKNVLFNGSPIPGVSLTIDDLEVTIAHAYITGLSLAVGSYPIVVEYTKGNSVTYTLVVKATA
jgi:phi13 family phage major tail protein